MLQALTEPSRVRLTVAPFSCTGRTLQESDHSNIRCGRFRKPLTINCLHHRDDRIRTSDPLNPIQVRYRAALRPVLTFGQTAKLTGTAERHNRTGSLAKGSYRGNSTVNRVPSASVDVTSIRPPCAWTSCAAM